MPITQATGRRKTSTARVLFYTGGGQITVNGKPLKVYFPNAEHQQCVLAPLRLVNSLQKYNLVIHVRGGGTTGQREAIRHGISRGILVLDPATRATLKAEKMLTRDPRHKERKKYGLRKARKDAPFRKR